MHKLIVLRGNSGSGKTTIAKELQQMFGDNTMLISQDAIRRDMLKVKDGENTKALPLLEELLRYGRKHSEIVILEGILNAEWYRALFERAVELYGENVYAYYFDIPFEETVKRHKTKPNCKDFGAEDMRRWWKEKDYAPVLHETRITADQDKESIVREIYHTVTAKRNTPALETERLILRKFTEEDMDALFLILKDKEANQFLPWYPVKNLDETRRFYEERYASKYAQPRAYAYAICLKEDNFPIGYIKVDMEEHHDFGYGLRREYWNRGIATEAGKAVIEQVKKDGLPYITATHDRNNPRSGNVMQKVGMKYCYSYEEQWQPKDFPVIFRMYQLNFNDNDDFVYKKYWNESENHFIEKIW